MKNFDKEEQDFQDTYDIWINNEDPSIIDRIKEKLDKWHR